MKIARTLLFGILLAGSARASFWSDLWYRRDQQGEDALHAGDSQRAAELFEDPRRRAYAELQSGQYAAAAKRLESFGDAASQYNRGNALARSGDLPGALDAYDGALKHPDLESSLRRDAQHNRDLVARQLQAQDDRQQSSSGQPPPKGKAEGKPRSNESKDGSGDSGSAKPPGTAGAASPPPGDRHEPDGGAGGSTPLPRTSSADESQQKAAGRPVNGGRDSPGSGARDGTEQRGARNAAPGDALPSQTERQIALEQWLRQIPDDPGGLLRRKFMIEHLMKQQQVQP